MHSDCVVSALQYQDNLDTSMPRGEMMCVPEHMSSLRSLVELKFVMANSGWQELFNICMLTNLQTLRLVAASTVEIGHAFESLVKLRGLPVAAVKPGRLMFS